MTLFLTVEDVIALHDEETSAPLLDRGKLEGAVGQPGQTFGGSYVYPTLIRQAAVLMRGVCQAHAFLDGNKRAAWLAMVAFLDLNGVELQPVRIDAAETFVKQVATGLADVEAIALWLNDHS